MGLSCIPIFEVFLYNPIKINKSLINIPASLCMTCLHLSKCRCFQLSKYPHDMDRGNNTRECLNKTWIWINSMERGVKQSGEGALTVILETPLVCAAHSCAIQGAQPGLVEIRESTSLCSSTPLYPFSRGSSNYLRCCVCVSNSNRVVNSLENNMLRPHYRSTLHMRHRLGMFSP